MLTDRSNFRSNNQLTKVVGIAKDGVGTIKSTNLPTSLQQSPDRDDIILFAPLQTVPKNADL